MDTVTIGKQITALRKGQGMTQEDVAKQVGVSSQAVSKWENGGVPDTELLPKIAELFGVSIDSLFGIDTTDYNSIRAALSKKLIDTPPEKQFQLLFRWCWDMERALMGRMPEDAEYEIETLEKDVEKTSLAHSSILSNYGFTQMGVAGRLQYFLMMPEISDKDAAFFQNTDYVSFFQDFSHKDVFDSCVLLHKRESGKAFTPGLLMKNLGLDFERAMEIIQILRKYHMISCTQLELDDLTQEIYSFKPAPSFTLMLLFVQELIHRPSIFYYFCESRQKPWL
ncbi:MAG: helix-turn-helix domain-containing protein [Lachnospiraceae bacterium]|jgi:transcriptional regulator with XRE-family HTH domain|nr:helix-turn-helix domain-containing protein [Lachnospiraceae bacterium]